jgi:mono/diheme cytochrome c family protein
MSIRLPIIGLLLLCCGFPAAAVGASAADVAQGQTLARTWCSNCHAVDGGGSVADAAPPFREIAARTDLDRDRLRGWLSTPHDRMPNLSLGRAEIDALIDYLQSLKR